MAAQNPSTSKHGVNSDTSKSPLPPLDPRLYPTPLSPPYPDRSRDVELSRAVSAASRSALFTFTQTDVVFEDEWLLVVDKPPGVYCESLLSSYYSSVSFSIGNNDVVAVAPELHLANRLDRDTSGLMVITKSHKVATKLVKAFTEHKVRKTYIALCVGHCEWKRVRVVSGHGRSKHGAWRVYGVSDVSRGLPGGSVVKHMETTFQVLSVNQSGMFEEPMELVDDGEAEGIIVVEERAVGRVYDGDKNDEFLVRAYPQSGRTHQIRLHCQYLGMPIKGDVKYGGVDRWKGVDCEYHNLHAESLSFDHPVTGISLQFHAPLPSWASEVFKATISGC